jgi:hypothetical protein
MSDKDFQELKADIEARGLLNPIVMYEGKILDGNSRYRACLELGIEPKFTTFTNTVISSLDYTISQNLARRHLTGSQKAAIAVEYKKLLSIQVRKRHIKNMSIRMKATIRNEPVPDEVKGIKPKSSQLAGDMFGINYRCVEKACAIEKRDKSLLEDVKSGKEPLETAYRRVMNKPTRTGRPPTSHIDRIARKVVNELDFTDYTPPETVHCSDYEIKKFDRYMNSLGFSLCVNRVGDTWDAIYTKTQDKLASGYPTFNGAILGAGKAALVKAMESKAQ